MRVCHFRFVPDCQAEKISVLTRNAFPIENKTPQAVLLDACGVPVCAVRGNDPGRCRKARSQQRRLSRTGCWQKGTHLACGLGQDRHHCRPARVPSEKNKTDANRRLFCFWRRERDSNPRYGFPYTRFPGVHLQPLGHLSKVENIKQFSICQHNTYLQSTQLQVVLY